MGFSKQEHWSELPCPTPGDLPNPGTELASLTSPALAGGFFTTSATWEALNQVLLCLYFIFWLDVASMEWIVALFLQPRKEDNCYYLSFRTTMELTRACGSTGGCHLLTAYSRKSSPTIPCSLSSYPNDQTHHSAYWCSTCLIV